VHEVHWPAWLVRSEVSCWNTRFVVERGFLSCVHRGAVPCTRAARVVHYFMMV